MAGIKKVGLVIKSHVPSIGKILSELVSYLESKGLECVLEDEGARIIKQESHVKRAELPDNSDLIIVLGGDGTLLSIAHHAARARVPVMGVNLGRLGFLTEIPLDEVVQTVEAVLSGEPKVMSLRWLLEARTPQETNYCLNDIVVARGTLSRMIELVISVDGKDIAILKSDGLIISTPTGSTAYSLAAGGPIIHPNIPAMMITPICPHKLTFRPILVPETSAITIKLLTRGEKVYLTFDGQRGRELLPDDVVEVKKSLLELQLINSPLRNYYDLVKEKLNWAG